MNREVWTVDDGCWLVVGCNVHVAYQPELNFQLYGEWVMRPGETTADHARRRNAGLQQSYMNSMYR